MAKSPKVTIGVLSYNDQKYLEHNIPALLAQDYPDFEIVVRNNSPEPETINKWLQKKYPQVTLLEAGGNVGFGQGHNDIINKAAQDSEFYLCFNSDMVATPNYVTELVATLKRHAQAGVVTGKLLAWSNFPDNPQNLQRNQIDTVGLIAKKNFRVVDKGQGELDQGQYDESKIIYGASGASPMFRIKALQDIAHEPGEYFDKHFFMYKEDVDLAHRMNWAGWQTVFTAKAVAWHDRTAADAGGIIKKIRKRREMAVYIKENSFLNQLLLTVKNWSPEFSITTKLRITWFLLKYCLYVAVFDTKTLKVLKKYRELKPIFKERGRQMPRKISAKEFEKLLV